MDGSEKAKHQALAKAAAEQVRHCYSKTAKRLMARECLRHLRDSLVTTNG